MTAGPPICIKNHRRNKNIKTTPAKNGSICAARLPTNGRTTTRPSAVKIAFNQIESDSWFFSPVAEPDRFLVLQSEKRQDRAFNQKQNPFPV